jgi:hydroxyethylthiazole kinase-like uncharacterized protein yjeF
MLVLSAAEMQECDRITSERFGVPSIELMRSASKAVAEMAADLYPNAKRATVLCGRGNNGGDGMMAARLLAQSGLEVSVLLLGAPAGLKGDAAHAWADLIGVEGCSIRVATTAEEVANQKDLFATDFILDAVLGTGFKPPMRGLPLAALEIVKNSAVPVLAVDLPSGWGADENTVHQTAPVFPADAVITFTSPKPAHVFGQLTRRWHQPVVVAPIGSPQEAIVSSAGLDWAGAALEIVQRPRPFSANKGTFGHVLVVGGAMGSAGGKAGAPAMATLAALRVGAGLATAAVPETALTTVASLTPEIMTWPLLATHEGQIAAANLRDKRLEQALTGKTVMALGPGMGTAEETGEFLMGLLERSRLNAVLDADALNILARYPGLLPKLAEGRTLVLTPHPGEMARLTGQTVAEIQANRLQIARLFAWNNRVTLVLKGARTVIAHPDGRVAVNTTGNPGLAKGGSGDILTGMMAGLLAQYPEDPERAVEAAVYLHGLTADLRVRATDEHTLLATESLEELPRAFRFRWRAPNGNVWVQGLPQQSFRKDVQ